MDEMIDRVAQAIRCADDPTRGDPIGVTLHLSEFIQGETAEERMVEVMSICRSAARAAVEAMREPTPEMVAAGESVLIGTDAPNYVSGSIFNAMIDAALTPERNET